MMKARELEKILSVLNTYSPKGVGIFTLAKETQIGPNNLRNFLTQYPEYFVQLPDEPLYQINRFGQFHGDKRLMLEYHQKQFCLPKAHSSWLLFMLLIGVFVSLSAVFLD
ncbi:hypothetical protein [Neptunicella marina]|uniref:Uncharacterized protein n=1 Tax=Neptunicella marina TaxID=2125989 RepID=A0A8J6IVG8_9ALTE|nr:hypothetical protein [Neptunicella marina]MBC3767114.1 hypothetical protein [Neptunicella marina]